MRNFGFCLYFKPCEIQMRIFWILDHVNMLVRPLLQACTRCFRKVPKMRKRYLFWPDRSGYSKKMRSFWNLPSILHWFSQKRAFRRIFWILDHVIENLENFPKFRLFFSTENFSRAKFQNKISPTQINLVKKIWLGKKKQFFSQNKKKSQKPHSDGK